MTGNEFAVQDTQGSSAPSDSLAVAYEVIKPTTDDEFIAEFGKGNYTTAEMYKQLHRFPNAMYEDAAWGDRVEERAFHEARQEIVEEGLVLWQQAEGDGVAKTKYAAWDELPETAGNGVSKDDFEDPEDYGEKVLQEQPKVRRYELVQDLTGYHVGERGPNARTMEMVNEIGRAKDGLIVNNTTRNVHEHRGDPPAQDRTRR